MSTTDGHGPRWRLVDYDPDLDDVPEGQHPHLDADGDPPDLPPVGDDG